MVCAFGGPWRGTTGAAALNCDTCCTSLWHQRVAPVLAAPSFYDGDLACPTAGSASFARFGHNLCLPRKLMCGASGKQPSIMCYIFLGYAFTINLKHPRVYCGKLLQLDSFKLSISWGVKT